MRYTNQFIRFDPLKGNVNSNVFGGHLERIASRARKVLKGRTVAELHSAAQFVDWAIDCHIENINDANGIQDEHAIERSDSNDIEWFEKCCGEISFSSNTDFANGSYEDYFAVLSMWHLIDALVSAGLIPPEYPNFPISHSVAADYAIEAMQALCISDTSHFIDYWKGRLDKASSASEKYSINAKKAAVLSHIKDNELRKQGIALYYEKYSAMSVQQAAKLIGKEVSRSPVTVAKWLYEENKKHKKQT